jgi:5-methylcytosine-specific restriction endonuclease McrA
MANIREMQVDHIIPKKNFVVDIINKVYIPEFLYHLQEYDVDHIDNLFPTCRTCNNWKNVYNLEQFRKEISIQVERLEKNSANFRIAKRFWLIQETGKQVKFYFEKYKSYPN